MEKIINKMIISKIANSNFFAISTMLTFHKHTPFHRLGISACEYKSVGITTGEKSCLKHTLHSNNLYQIFTYVKNKDAELKNNPNKTVSGMILYAKTDEQIQPDNEYTMSGNKISVKTLDLNCDFEKIKEQLNHISEKELLFEHKNGGDIFQTSK